MLSDVEFSLFDRTMTRLSGSLAACERLRTTPVPFGYTLLIHQTAHMFCFMVPFGFADVLGPATPLAAGLVAYTFFGLDALGDELEEPFGTLPNDLPIAAISTVIEIDLRSMLGDTDLPPMPKPVDHILL
jgi:putative membrane protein